MRSIVRAVLGLSLLIAQSLALSAATLQPVSLALWAAGEAGYATFRIPSLVVTGHGTILAFAVGRKSLGSDWSSADILMRRSTDGGFTFSPSWRAAGNGVDTTDNPTAIADRRTGTLYLVYQQSYDHCFEIESRDDGVTFTAPRDITPVFDAYRSQFPWTVLAPGPGHGIVTRSGRIVVPVWLADGQPATPGGPRPHRPSEVVTRVIA
jgi:sialidase-1